MNTRNRNSPICKDACLPPPMMVSPFSTALVLKLTCAYQDIYSTARAAQTQTAMSDLNNTLTSVIRVFPWNNGIVLSQGSMRARLLEWWQFVPSPVPGIDSLVVVTLPTFLVSVHLP